MRNLSTALVVLLAMTLNLSPAEGAPAWNRKVVYLQPNGDNVTLYIRGDELSHWYETEDGIPVVRNENGTLCYATIDHKGNAAPSDLPATDIARRSDKVRRLLAGQNSDEIRKKLAEKNHAARIAKAKQPETISQNFPTTGVVNGLVILAEYQDVKFNPAHTREVYDKLSNEKNYTGEYASGSVYDYFVEQSYGKFTPHFDVVGPVTLPHDMEHYGMAELAPEMIIEACNIAKNSLGTDFSKYDTNKDGNVDFVFVIYAGYGESQGGPAESIWPQKVDLTYTSWNTYDGLYLADAACSCELRGYNGSDMDGIGTFCHEFSHILGLPDVYDTTQGPAFGMNDWDAMDHGIYLDNSRTPAGYTAMDKFTVGWLEPIVLDEPATDLKLRPLSESPDAYFIVCDENPGEYFTLENRQNTGFDSALPGHGMIISHIDYVPALWSTNRVNASTNPYEHIELVAADNIKSIETLAGDPFPGKTGTMVFSDDSSPAAAWHTSGGKVNSPITNIREENGLILFDFKGGTNSICDTDKESLSVKSGLEQIDIINPSESIVTVYAIDGTVASRSAAARQHIRLNSGIYIVGTPEHYRKVLVKAAN